MESCWGGFQDEIQVVAGCLFEPGYVGPAGGEGTSVAIDL